MALPASINDRQYSSYLMSSAVTTQEGVVVINPDGSNVGTGTGTSNQGTRNASHAQSWWVQLSDTTNDLSLLASGSDALTNATVGVPSYSLDLRYNGASWDRLRSTGALSQSTFNGTLNSYTNSGTGVPIELMMGWDRTSTAQAYRAISLGSDGTVGVGTSAAVADGQGNTFSILTTPGGTNNSAPLGVFPMLYNGNTWDRMRSDGTTTGRLLVGGAGTAGTPAGGVLSVQGVASGTVIPSNVSQFGGNAVATGTGASGLGIPRVTVSNDSTVILGAGAATIGALTANQSVNVAQVNGITTLTGNGTTGTGSQRVTIASDNTAFSVNAILQTGTNSVGNIGFVNNANGTAIASGVYTTTQTQADQTNAGYRGIDVYLNISAYTDSTITLEIDDKDPVSGTYTALLTGTGLVASGFHRYVVFPGATASANAVVNDTLSATWRIKVTVAGATSGATWSVGYALLR